MTETRGELKWYAADVRLKLERATDRLLAELALRGEGRAKENVVDNDQVDTGFMGNSIYAVGPGLSTYAQAEASATARAPRPMLPQAPVGAQQSAIAAGAEYAIYQERKRSFLWRSLEQLQRDFGGIVQTVAREQK